MQTRIDPAPIPAHPDELSLGRLLRRFTQIVALLFCLFLVVRTTFVEPHGVPTGSMAPTIFGNHRECPCPRCGHSVVVGTPPPEDRIDPQRAAFCPNCGLSPIDVVALSDDISGDRLLVDRTAFRFRPPRRWEVAVFRAPDDSEMPYVKRVVGLPGEAIRICDGDVYADGELLRKPLEVLREMKVGFFDMDHPPQPMGWGPRWIAEAGAARKLPGGGTDAAPTPAPVVSETRLVLDASAGAETVLGIGYRHRNVDTGLDELIRDDLAYNGVRGVPKPVHDFVLDCEIEAVGGSGALAFRLGDGSDAVRLDIPIGPPERPLPATLLAHEGGSVPRSYPGLRFDIGRRHRLELAFADRRATVATDGRTAGSPLDLSVPKLGSAKDPNGLPPERRGTDRPLHIEARGVSVVVHHLKLSRDAHCRSEGTNGIAAAYPLGPTDYFLLGDNSANSEDSRAWTKAGVPEADFVGKPFFVHQPLRSARLVLNGNERRFQTIDWDRLRLLR